ncbi:MFS transporter [Pleomorphomonas sp. PLEO]|uniref:MFS transporter n=1 Tax=Pleomorphomonas sp. PLEO TaxID=3239306 RepID=UPI00351E23EC
MTLVSSRQSESVAAWSASISDAEQPQIPYRLGIALCAGVLLWLGPYFGTATVLLPGRVAIIDPGNKANIIAMLSISAMVVATVANILIGALSDLTRSRLGRRTPWLIAGSVGSAAMLILMGRAESVTMLLVEWCIFQVFLNAIVAPLLAVISDRIAPAHRGTISSIYAFGFTLGIYGGQFINARFLGDLSTGFVSMAVLILLSGPLAALIMREASSQSMPRRVLNRDMVLDNFSIPRRNARDYYLALFGKLMITTATFAIQGYQLFILTDYLKVTQDEVGHQIELISIILMVTALGMALVAGPISDKLGRRKGPVALAGLLVAIGALVPFFSTQPWTMLVYALIAGIGSGIFNSVDQALNVEVLPNAETAAKDLGVLNLANTGGQILGPAIAAIAISAIGYQMIFPTVAVVALIGVAMIAMIRSVR